MFRVLRRFGKIYYGYKGMPGFQPEKAVVNVNAVKFYYFFHVLNVLQRQNYLFFPEWYRLAHLNRKICNDYRKIVSNFASV